MNKVILLLAATIFAHIHSIRLLHRNLESGVSLKIIWGITEFIWGLWLLQQAFDLFKMHYLKRKQGL